MILIQRKQVNIGHDINIMREKGRAIVKKPGRVLQPAAGIQQQIAFIGDVNHHAGCLALLDEFKNLISEMMRVDENLPHACQFQTANHDFQQRQPVDYDQGFRAGIGQRAKPRP